VIARGERWPERWCHRFKSADPCFSCASQSPEPPTSPAPSVYPRLSYSARLPFCRNSAARALLKVVDRKKSNLCLSADVTTKEQLLRLAEQAGPHICLLKTHMDILSDFDATVPAALLALSEKHDFLLFEDRKFADIGSTVAAQYSGGVYRIASWSHIVNAHAIAGPGILAGLKQPVEKQLKESNVEGSTVAPRGLLLIAEMSSSGSLATGSYTTANLLMAEADPEWVCGFICQRAISKEKGMIHMSPGVQLPTDEDAVAPAAAASSSSFPSTPARTGTDSLGQQYTSPRDLLVTHGTDIIIVGRAIIQAKDAAKECERYRKAGWEAYEESLAASDAKK
jgi:orotidine 5'-phosphate decarboxylase subfamily 1